MLGFPRACGPAQKKRSEIMSAFIAAKGLDPQIGANVAESVHTNFAFSEVNVRRLLLTFLPLPKGVLYQLCRIHVLAAK